MKMVSRSSRLILSMCRVLTTLPGSLKGINSCEIVDLEDICREGEAEYWQVSSVR